MLIGRDTSFTVVARGNGALHYQWRHAGVPLADDGRITGTQTAQLHLTHAAVLDGGTYDVVVSNALRTVASLAESLTVLTPLAVGDGATGVTRFAGVSPMPVRGHASFRFELARRSHVRLALYDVSGRVVRMVLDEDRAAGVHEVGWEPSSLGATPAGILFARFEADGVKITRKLAVLR